MASLSMTHVADGARSGRLGLLKSQLRAALERRRIYRTTLNELSALSDRDLADLGLHRSMIRRIALEAANKV
ncbi:hypothetical protein U879_18155 [Defluviimonas sp. 20V17]|uniref:YjiS-like domain-containing protein n=1 Tax=Allgaiera indica TaxID=765699 RepID=A0AAN4USE9_9RHOB|nr:DUF1127 domain-containing protein [Allgaiera indica]KDB02312.1 hypothetical protein U879_18155 [Defluviimonas sp. 20V17]GHE02762.1 hypothetical protein GCM10008024_23580 [Allgaiera indica]SDX18104.1 protein of unknown function [Allgaiera indica]